MRNFWVAIIGVLMIASFAGTSFATAPVVQDIPDFRLLTVSGVVEDFDLNDYVTDYDDDPADLLWTIQDADGIAAALGANPNDNLLDISASATVAQGTMILRATDANEYSEDSSVVKYSTLMLVGPGLTQDYNLTPASDGIPRTLVIEADNDTVTTDINALIQPAQAPGAVELTVSIADLDGNLLAGDNTASAEYGDLSASIGTDGILTVSAPAGAYPITGMYQLSGAYRVGVKAKLTGGMGEANWDGMELLVSSARFPTRDDQNTPELLDKFGNFETLPLGDLAVGVNAMRALPSANNPRWYLSLAPTGAATAKVVNTGIPTSTWATSGQALEVSVSAEADQAFIQSELFTDILPGETITFAANVTTTTTAGTITTLPDVYMFFGSFAIASNYEGVLLQKATNTDAAAAQVPYGGSAGWRTLKSTFTADTVGAAIEDGASTVNVYQNGYSAAIVVIGHGASKVYVDNVRIYRDKSDIDKALGATKINPIRNNTTTFFDGEFESGDFAGLGWSVVTADGAAAVDTSGLNNMFTHDGDNALEVYLPNAATRTATQVEYVAYDINVDASAAGGVDNKGDGIYAMTAWFKTNAAAPKNAPGVMFGMADLRFLNVPFSDCGYAGAPLADGGWKKITVSSARYDYGNKLKLFAIIRADALAGLPSRTYFGSYQNADRFGALSDARVYVDDIQVHKVQDSAMYFDRSVFPVAD